MSPTTWGRKVIIHTIKSQTFLTFYAGATHRSLQVGRSSRRLQVNLEALPVLYTNSCQVPFFRLVFDRETGKPRGYGFCEFAGTSNLFPFRTPSFRSDLTSK